MIVDYLIVSSLYDFSTDLITQELERRGKKYLRLNREEFNNYRLTIDTRERLFQVKIHNKSYVITSSLKTVYYRQPIFLRNTPGEALSILEQLSRSQWMGFLRSLAIFEHAKWINPLAATYLAETKAYQLAVANSIGFNTPQTLIGNDYREFQKFEGEIIIKSLDTVLLREGDDCLFTYSTIKNTSELNDINVSNAPLTVQEYVSPKTDIRVTVIGKELIAVKITSRGLGIEEDWRTIERNKVEYTDIDLPGGTKALCFEMLKKLGLKFGAIDLIVSNDDYIFIEINPTGEWGWLVNEERKLHVDIVDLMVSEE